MEAVATGDHSLKSFNSVEHHYGSQIAPHIDLFSRLGAIFILKSSLAKQLHQLANLFFTPFALLQMRLQVALCLLLQLLFEVKMLN